MIKLDKSAIVQDKRKNPCLITSGKRKETAVKKKRKARRAFDKNPFKFTKKLFKEEKNGVLGSASTEKIFRPANYG